MEGSGEEGERDGGESIWGMGAGMGNQVDGARGACGRSLDHLTSFVHRPTVDAI